MFKYTVSMFVAVIFLYSPLIFAQGNAEPKEPLPYQRLAPTEEIDEPVMPDEPNMDNYEIKEPEEPQEPVPYGFGVADREPAEPTPFTVPDTSISQPDGQNKPYPPDNSTSNIITPAK